MLPCCIAPPSPPPPNKPLYLQVDGDVTLLERNEYLRQCLTAVCEWEVLYVVQLHLGASAQVLRQEFQTGEAMAS